MDPAVRKQILPTVIKALAPALLIYIGREEAFWKFFPDFFDSRDVPKWQLVTFIAGTAWAAILTPLQLAKAKIEVSNSKKEQVDLKADKVKAHITAVLKQVGCRQHKLQIRCFKHKRAWRNLLCIKKLKKGYLKPINLDGITTELRYVDHFEAYPHPEGVVGKVYSTGKRETVWNIEAENPFPVHEDHKQLVDSTKFVSAFPIRSRRVQDRGKIIAVLSIDCEQPVNIDDRRKLIFNTFVDTIGDFVETQLHYEQGKND